MGYSFVFAKTASRDLQALEYPTAQRVLKKIRDFCALKNPLEKARKLKGFEENTYRFRIGDYRAVFRLDKKTGVLVVLVVLRVVHRREVYNRI